MGRTRRKEKEKEKEKRKKKKEEKKRTPSWNPVDDSTIDGTSIYCQCTFVFHKGNHAIHVRDYPLRRKTGGATTKMALP
jgi:hypothetical protein